MCHSENAPEDEEDLYTAVYGLEEDYAGGEIYEDLMRTEQLPPLVGGSLFWDFVSERRQHRLSCVSVRQQAELDVRSCCLSEIKQTEEKYTETLESIEKVQQLCSRMKEDVNDERLCVGCTNISLPSE